MKTILLDRTMNNDEQVEFLINTCNELSEQFNINLHDIVHDMSICDEQQIIEHLTYHKKSLQEIKYFLEDLEYYDDNYYIINSCGCLVNIEYYHIDEMIDLINFDLKREKIKVCIK